MRRPRERDHMQHKAFQILDAKADGEAGTFEATVAVFNNVDRGGDRILPGAFTDTLAKWSLNGDPIPVILSHQWNDPMAHIGVVQEAKETNAGLWVKGQLDVEDNPVARQVHRLMQRRSLKEFSFGYDVPKGGAKRAKDGANDLSEINLVEVGPTLRGMNPATELHAVKSALTEHRLETELGEVKARLDKLEKALEDPKADETPNEPEARSVDPLEEKARAAVLGVLSEGSTPPATVTREQPPRPDMEPDELKRRSRDLIVQLLND
jgi:HK97 family phage prohead protease